MDRLSVSVRPKGSESFFQYRGFYYAAPYTVEVSPTTIVSQKVINEPGTYVAWVSYYRDGFWHWLKPETEFTVG